MTSILPMTPSSSGNMQPSPKRKADDTPPGKENDSGEKRQKTTILDVTKRRVVFKQAPIAFDVPRRPRLKLETFLVDAEEASETILEIPQAHWAVVALAGAELTASSEGVFVSQLKKALDIKELDMISPSVWSALLPKLFTCVQYGVLSTDFPSSSTGPRKIPVALQIRAWEVRDEYLTPEQLETVATRREERGAARREIEAALKTLDDVELLDLLLDKRRSRESTATSRRSASPVKLSPEEVEAARVKQEEKEAKRAAAEEKRTQKEERRAQKEKEEAAREEERQKKARAMEKQKATMSSFFKPKTKPVEIKREVRDFDRVFKGIAPRPNVDWAPLNRFRKEAMPPLGGGRPRTGLRTPAPYGTIGEVWQEYQDAEDPRAVVERVKNDRKYPWKTLSFDQQTRPPWVGTHTKRSMVVGPRTPFAQDPVIDYSYDSGDDWEEDQGGEDIDDVEDDEAESESEGEFDDWLDDDVYSPEPAELEQSRLPMKQAVKREVKKVARLAPFVKGPCWEGKGETGLEEFAIQLLNNAPNGIDPFSYVADDAAQVYTGSFSTTLVGPHTVPTLINATPGEAKAPKSQFPDTFLPEFIRLVQGNTSIRSDLVTQLKTRFDGVTKTAIEHKLREVASRKGKSKESAWEVKEEVLVSALQNYLTQSLI